MKVSLVRRNQSAYNLKCLTAFYGYPQDVFCLALNTFDRFITKVKVSWSWVGYPGTDYQFDPEIMKLGKQVLVW